MIYFLLFIVSALASCSTMNAMDNSSQEKKLHDKKKMYLTAANQFFNAYEQIAQTPQGQLTLEAGKFAYEQAKKIEDALQTRTQKNPTDRA